MRSVIFALAATAMAADVSVVWRHEKSSGSTSLAIHSADDHSVLAESCGDHIGTVDFSNVDENGAGNFSVEGNTFAVSSKNQDGVSCTRIYNGAVAVVNCSPVDFDVPEGTPKSADCFTDDEAKASFVALKARHVDDMVSATRVEQRDSPSKTFRPRQQCYDETGTAQIGDGDPHQNYYHKQISVST
ncbi:hypothetical protein N0V83_003403 [Neocucurbitaria cava]|uniref:Uncharacterized protein n=1 Tax=Neocucurbitaria cava TaxID=798079 RepID=A0A9W9CPE3_9PLEO|nr:hypothetical protein N0V83_003403 [Neocucurbitaria cava]